MSAFRIRLQWWKQICCDCSSLCFKWPFWTQIVAISCWLCQRNPRFPAYASRSCYQMFCVFNTFLLLDDCQLFVNSATWKTVSNFVNSKRWSFLCFYFETFYSLFNLLCLYIRKPDKLHTMRSSYVIPLIFKILITYKIKEPWNCQCICTVSALINYLTS